MPKQDDPFAAIDTTELAKVSGGAQRVAAGSSSSSDDQLITMLSQIGSSIQALASHQNSGMDPMTMMMMMMMMGGGFGGGGGHAVAPPSAPPSGPVYVRVNDGSGQGLSVKKGSGDF